MIHPSAIIDPKAKVASDVQVGPYSVIGPEVTLAKGNVLHSHVIIQGKTTLGEGNEIYPFVVLGTPAQDLKAKAGEGALEIGAHNIIREHSSIHLSNSSKEITQIGNHNFIMGGSHVGHNCRLGDHVILTQGTGLSGHVTVEDDAVVGGQAGIHQYVRIGRLAMVAGKAAVISDVPPFAQVRGIPARFAGLNEVALKRGNFSPQVLEYLTQAFRLLYSDGNNLQAAIGKITAQVPQEKEVGVLVDFLKGCQRGICKP
jgi:UDP-N-acetylglucosamine acyltransferase